MRAAARKPGITLKEGSLGNYSAIGVEPGSYVLEVSKQVYLWASYEITLNEGRNSTQVVLGKRGQPFFYAAGRKIYFKRVPDEFLIVAQGENAGAVSEQVLARRGMSGVDAFSRAGEPRPVRDTSFMRVSTPKAKRPDAQAMRAIAGDLEKSGLKATPAVIVKRGEGPVQGLTSDLTVKFEDGVSEQEVSRIAKEHGLKVKRRVLSAGNAYVLTSGTPPSYELLDVARELMEKDPVIFAEPQLLMEVEKDQYTPNDPLFNLLTHLPLINCDDAWEILGEWDPSLRGGSTEVCIAVFDPDGVTPDHPDLTANLTDGASKLQTSFNFSNMTAQTVGGLGGDHGTQCSGVAQK